MGWGRGKGGLVDVSPHVVATDQLQAGRPGILAELDDPQSAAGVEVEVQGVGDQGLAQDLVEGQVGRDQQPRFLIGSLVVFGQRL